jgi:hypothetical protein
MPLLCAFQSSEEIVGNPELALLALIERFHRDIGFDVGCFATFD